MAMVKNTMPSPPIHWVSERQKSSPCGRASTLSMMVAPVVVKPDIVSKKALVKSGTQPLSMKGSVPNSEKSTHTTVTTK